MERMRSFAMQKDKLYGDVNTAKEYLLSTLRMEAQLISINIYDPTISIY